MSHKIQTAILSAFVMILFVLLVFSKVAGQSPDSGNDNSEGIRIRYARASWQLAQLELEIVLNANKEIPNLHTPRTIRRLRNNIDYAKEMLRYETERGENGLHKLHLRELEVELEVARLELNAARKLNEQLPGAVGDLEFGKLRVATDVARLALDKAREPAVVQSREDHLQWQIDRMRTELTRLYILMDKALSRN